MFSCFKCVRNKKKHDLDNVYVLDYSHQSLQDVPPEIFDYERTLTELNLGSNRIIDLPPQLFLCHELKILCLNNNDIGNIPPAIGSLTSLTVLDLYRNNLMVSSIPDNIKSLKHLKYLNLSVNLLEKLPDTITCLINLEELYLNDTSIEFLQANFGRLVNLKILELRDNRLLSLTKSMSRLINLLHLDIGHNKFQQFPLVICSFENLQELILDENLIEYLPETICNLKKLLYFDCSDNDLFKIPNELENLIKLQDLNLSSNQLQDIPITLRNLHNLVTLKLNNNQLNEIPDIFSDMKLLEELTLNDNFLVYLPISIGRLRKLKFLTLDNNYIDYLPQEIGSCQSLSILSLRCNNLIELPPDIGHLSNLKVLNIVNNNIRNLPISIMNLTNLSALWISDNQSQPMVQLQKDHDGDFNYFLTCYMFPQCKVNRNNDFMSQSSSDEDLLSRNNQESNEDKVHIEPKPRRICFSGETTIQIDRPGRLLRSPTPYPKELRVMAKTLNDHNKTINSSTSSYSRLQVASPSSESVLLNEPQSLQHPPKVPIQIKEAKIANNISNLSNSSNNNIMSINNSENEILNETTSLLPPINHLHIHPNHNPSYSIQNALEITQNMYIVPPNIDEFDSASSYCQSQIDLNINSNIKPNDYDDMLSLNSSVSQDMIMLNKRRIYDNNFIYDNQMTYFTPEQPQTQINHILPPPPLPRIPPPYHIAKIHSKISPHDLSIYETIRNRTNIGNVYENTKELKENINKLNEQKFLIENFNGNYSGNMETIGEESNENESMPSEVNGHGYLSNDGIRNENVRNSLTNFEHQYDQNSNLENNNVNTHEHVQSNSNHNNKSSSSESSITSESAPSISPPPLPIIPIDESPKKSPSKPWLFGQHKNPTVIQFSIRSGSSAGFTLVEVPQMGIYIKDIELNCDAHEKLRKMDKILDIDGYDFTKNITQEEANQILLESGNIINIMVSRI